MKNLVVTVLDTTGIQSYIFGSNRLRENVGSSYLVAQSTDSWVKEILRQLEEEKDWKIQISDHQKLENKSYIEDGDLTAELVYAGGGNTVLLFQTIDHAKNFTKKLSRKILKEAPGINLVVAHKEFDWNNKSYLLYNVIQDVMTNDIEIAKQKSVLSSPLLGLGVTASCESTQLVAVGMSEKFEDDEPYLISREIQKKLDAARQYANDKLKEIFPSQYDYPLRFDQMGRSLGESSYIAVVHADGNNMGKRFQELSKGKENREYITAIQQLSHDVYQAGVQALQSVIKVLENAIEKVDENDKKVNKVKNQFILKGNYLPIRPIVYGGDDVTFVCDGRLGLELARLYLEEFERFTVDFSDGKGKATACAGVCVVKSHYPFARAYQISEDLCKSAKKFIKEERFDSRKVSAIDWHFASSGLFGLIKDIREREYSEDQGSLVMRPVLIDKHDKYDSEWRTWKGFQDVVEGFNKGRWKNKNIKQAEDVIVNRNKIIALRDVLRRGGEATQEFLSTYQIANLPIYPESSCDLETLSSTGWLEECGYFDAIEAMEFYFSLIVEDLVSE